MTDVNKFVIASLQIEGVHCWPDCPFHEVAFLKHRHRHMFHIYAAAQVEHNDRQVEIIMLKRQIASFFRIQYTQYTEQCVEFGTMSCEDIAEVLMKQFNLAWCQVLEDGENGALIQVIPQAPPSPVQGPAE